MIGKINSPSFNGRITVYASTEPTNRTNHADKVKISTDHILDIKDNRTRRETEILVSASNPPFDRDRNYYVSESNASFNDILAAYTAACQNDNVNIKVGDEK